MGERGSVFEAAHGCGMVTPVEIHRNTDRSSLLVRSCSPGEIKVNDRAFDQHILLSPEEVIPGWSVGNPAEIAPGDLEAAVAMQPDLIILGSGDQLVFPPAAVSASLLEQGIGFEVMDTRAACRTYNLLAMDGRSVVAALIQLKGP